MRGERERERERENKWGRVLESMKMMEKGGIERRERERERDNDRNEGMENIEGERVWRKEERGRGVGECIGRERVRDRWIERGREEERFSTKCSM